MSLVAMLLEAEDVLTTALARDVMKAGKLSKQLRLERLHSHVLHVIGMIQAELKDRPAPNHAALSLPYEMTPLVPPF